METWDLPISKEALLTVLDEAKLDLKEFPTCEYYSSQIGIIAFNDDRLKNAANFLTRLFALRLSTEQNDVQFSLPGTSWTEMEFADAQLDVLTETVEGIPNPELRSRIYDILWIRKRIVDDARSAAHAYVDSAEVCLNAKSPGAGKRFARGISLVSMIKDYDLVASLGARVDRMLSSADLHDFLVAESIDELLCNRAFDPNILLAHCQARIDTTTLPLAKQRFCTLAQRCALRAKKPVDAEKALRELAASYEHDADGASMKIIAVSHLKRSIQTLRRVPGADSERERIHQKMLRIQQELGDEFKPIEVCSLDLTEQVTNAQARIRGKSKIVGIAKLVMASQFHDAAKAVATAIDTIRLYPLQNMFGVEKFGSTYKSATAIPPVGAEEIPDERVFYSMINEYQCLFGIVAHGTIVPMINELNLCHHITLADISEFVYRSPVIPDGHHEYFCLGILAGIQGRFVEAINCLVPQLETIIRHTLQSDGVIVSGLDQKGNQREFDLNKLLEMPETEQRLTQDVVTTLRIIFTHQAGPNIRNELAHGMLPSGACASPAAIYGWWTIVWLVLNPIASVVLDLERAKISTDRAADNV